MMRSLRERTWTFTLNCATDLPQMGPLKSGLCGLSPRRLYSSESIPSRSVVKAQVIGSDLRVAGSFDPAITVPL